MAGWTDEEKAKYLAVALRGSAQQMLSHVPDGSRAKYVDILKVLEKRFAPANIEELYKSELRMRRRQPGESLLELGQAIQRLVFLAYPSAPQDVMDTLSKDNFLESLTDSEMRLKVLLGRPKTYDETIQAAVSLDACTTAEARRYNRTKIRGVDIKSSDNESEMDEIRRYMKEMLNKVEEQENRYRLELNKERERRRKEQRSAPYRRTNGTEIVCYNCRQKGHTSRQCPEPRQQIDPQKL
ncbi:eukaryotic translation initiation factor 3 subunit A-like [Gigantopelta aegis]|uniref:eukaryotic translation initiation factor 3 subunit A-like n=1 Tax=Gigantopelta aegis TaxID=1735272 RepID=UPI001B88D46D|nr:eukaryotic translation initiation factor 3 subunit A-like [Gigantopelta aegis]